MLTELIANLEAATMPRLDLDRDIYFVVQPRIKECWPHFTDKEKRDICPRYTESIDLAATLVPADMAWTLGQNVHHRYWQASVNTLDADGKPIALGFSGHTELKSAAIALCTAAMKAREAANV